MSLGLAVLIFTLIVTLDGSSFFLFDYPRLKKELQQEIDRDVRNNLDEINNIKSRISLSILRIVSSAALLLFTVVLSLIYGAF